MDDLRQDLAPILTEFPREQRLLLPALRRVQSELGRLPLWALEAVGEHLRVPPSEVYGVATHYPELRLEPRGQHVVRVCTGLSCRVLGARDLLRALETQLGVGADETRADGSVSLQESHCAFVCSVGPVVEIDGVVQAGVSAEQAVALAREFAPGAGR